MEKTHRMFPVPLFQYEIDNYNELNTQLEEYIYGLQKMDKEGQKVSNAGGWHSPYFNIKDSDLLKKFLAIVHKYLFKIIKEF